MGTLSAFEVTSCIQQAQAGNAEALGRLLDQYRPYLRLLARLHIGARLAGKADASDVVQETLLDAGRDFGRFGGAGEQELLAWLRRILATNLADAVRRFCRAESREVGLERRLVDDLGSSSHGLGQCLVSPDTTPAVRAARREQAVLVAEALEQLPEDYSQVLVMRHMEGLSFAEIAERMGRSVDSVKGTWTRALARLRDSMEGLP